LHRFLIYEDDFSEKNARIQDIAYFISDVTEKKHLKLLANYGLKSPVLPLDLERSLDIIPFFFGNPRPGRSINFNTITSEIVSTQASPHPLLKSPGKHQTRSKAIRLKSYKVGENGRKNEFPKLHANASAEANMIRFSDVRINDLSMPAARSLIARREGKDKFICGGKHSISKASEIISLCESMERFQVIFRPPETELVFNSYSEIKETAVNPENLFYSVGKQVFNPAEKMYWTEAFNFLAEKKLVPAQEIWFDTQQLPGEKLWIMNTTNGCAVGGSFEEATLFAILEVIERDSFLTSWYLRKPCKRIKAEELKHEQLHFLLAKIKYFKPQFDIIFLDLRNDLNVPAVLALSIRKKGVGPKFLCGVASGLNYANAAFSALKDIQNLLCFTPTIEETRLFEKLADDKTKILNPEEHQGIFTLDKMFKDTDFFDSGEFCSYPDIAQYELTESKTTSYDVKTLIEKLNLLCQKAGSNLYYKDISHKSLKDKGFWCVKIIPENLFPMWYGYYNKRLSFTERLKSIALSEKNEIISSTAQINQEIHPFG
jgi:ribosomal protein S12 methylthiotransferase accessory factor